MNPKKITKYYLILRATSLADLHPIDAIFQACELANKLNCQIEFEKRGVSYRISPGMDPDNLCRVLNLYKEESEP